MHSFINDGLLRTLVTNNLIPPESVLAGDIQIRCHLRRNQNFRIELGDGSGFLLKRPYDPTDRGDSTIVREAAFYQYCQSSLAFRPILDVIPRLVYFDADTPMLGMSLISPAKPMWTIYRDGDSSEAVAEAAYEMGRTLGIVHSLLGECPSISDHSLPALPSNPPWALQIHKPSPELLAAISPANYRALEIIQDNGDLCRELDHLASEWQTASVIHGDVRCDNVLVRQITLPDQKVSVALVDWEFAQKGDRAWDLACAFQDALQIWVTTMPQGTSFDTMVESAPTKLSRIQFAMRSLWKGYRNTGRISADDESKLLRRAVRLSGARLLQAAYEVSNMEMQLPSAAVLLLQLAANVLVEPGAAQLQLYGIYDT